MVAGAGTIGHLFGKDPMSFWLGVVSGALAGVVSDAVGTIFKWGWRWCKRRLRLKKE